MPVLAYEGVVENGQIKLIEPMHLSEKARVLVVLRDTESAQKPVRIMSPRLVKPEQAEYLRKTVTDLKPDAPL